MLVVLESLPFGSDHQILASYQLVEQERRFP